MANAMEQQLRDSLARLTRRVGVRVETLIAQRTPESSPVVVMLVPVVELGPPAAQNPKSDTLRQPQIDRVNLHQVDTGQQQPAGATEEKTSLEGSASELAQAPLFRFIAWAKELIAKLLKRLLSRRRP
jgi:hypothetical protein